MLMIRSIRGVKTLAIQGQMNDRWTVVPLALLRTHRGLPKKEGHLFLAGTAEPFRVSPPEAVVYSKAN